VKGEQSQMKWCQPKKSGASEGPVETGTPP
jgi:hypothetical protein